MHHEYDSMRLATGALGIRRLTLTAWDDDEARILGRLAERLVGSPDPMPIAVAKLLPAERPLEVEELGGR